MGAGLLRLRQAPSRVSRLTFRTPSKTYSLSAASVSELIKDLRVARVIRVSRHGAIVANQRTLRSAFSAPENGLYKLGVLVWLLGYVCLVNLVLLPRWSLVLLHPGCARPAIGQNPLGFMAFLHQLLQVVVGYVDVQLGSEAQHRL
ncbi:uncharacterized protein [Drosophila takahashii]|uniref:uncharacterized protein n=1 Tax=Drosophila takahashii TaxID=29030 RepID=UPI0038992046